MNDLETYFYGNKDRLIDKWIHYFSIYERYFEKYRNRPVVILEIGVFQGGSLQMWKNYFGENAKIYGIDIDPKCKELEEENIEIFIGSQSDRNFLRKVKNSIPKADIILDDGGHTMKQQRISFEELIDHVKDDGVYMCEDCHTSYWSSYGGGYRRKGTFIEYSKKLVDKLNGWHSKRVGVDSITKSVRSISFYDSIVVFEKAPMKEPSKQTTGIASFPQEPCKDTFFSKLFERFLRLFEKALAFFRIPSINN